METLPFELLQEICSHIYDLLDLKNFRLVSHTFASVGERYLVPDVSGGFFEEQSDKLLRIATSPKFGRHVGHLRFNASIPVEYTNYDEWYEHRIKAYTLSLLVQKARKGTDWLAISPLEDSGLLRSRAEKEALARYPKTATSTSVLWQQYLDFLRTREKIDMEAKVMADLANAFEHTPRMQHLTVAGHDLSTPAASNVFQVVCPSESRSSTLEHTGDTLAQILSTLQKARRQLRSLTTMDIHINVFRNEHLAKTFESLEVLRMTVHYNQYDDYNDLLLNQIRLGQYLRCAGAMSVLQLGGLIGSSSNSNAPKLDLELVLEPDNLGRLRWDRLSCVTFSDFVVSENILVKFL